MRVAWQFPRRLCGRVYTNSQIGPGWTRHRQCAIPRTSPDMREPASRHQTARWAAYACHRSDKRRTIVFQGFFDRATGHYDHGTGQISVKIGYGLLMDKVAVRAVRGGARGRGISKTTASTKTSAAGRRD